MANLSSFVFPDFSNIDLLKKGSSIQQKSWSLLNEFQLIQKLQDFNPLLTGTLPLDIFIEQKSDIDISCEVYLSMDFIQHLSDHFGDQKNFTVREKTLSAVPSVIVNFQLEEFPVEIVGQPLPVMNQISVRHLYIEYALLKHYGESFRQQVIALKESGLKTEPAFAHLLKLDGDPYTALLKLDPSAYMKKPFDQ